MSKKILIENFDTNVKKENGNYYLEGIFIQCDVENRNGRIYPLEVMENEVNNYIKNFVNDKRALGELGHSDNTQINLDRVSHLITHLKRQGSNFYGRAKLLDTPMGKIAKNLVDSGVKLGMSTRGVGSTQLSEDGSTEIVCDDYVLITAGDIVVDPSGPACFVEAIVEEKEWLNSVYSSRTLTEAKNKIKRCKPNTISKEKSIIKTLKYLGMI